MNIYKNNNQGKIYKLENELFRRTSELDSIKRNKDKRETPEPDEYIDKYVNRDRETITNPLYPPLKRNYHFSQPVINRMPINIETRESGGDYQQVGMLHKNGFINKDLAVTNPGHNDESVLLALFGKPIYKGSSNWNYYVLSHKDNIKIPLVNKNNNCTDNTSGCAELNNDDIVDIEPYNGKFKTQIYKFNAPKYIPYL
tara:strand:- start:2630 stop:3226 length:597 start_codon:yes stop_codon:yes gene_type:complete